MFRLRQLSLLAALAAALVYAGPSAAQTIIDEWQSVKAPPAPALKAVTLDPKSTAILVMDFVNRLATTKSGRGVSPLYPRSRSYRLQRAPRA